MVTAMIQSRHFVVKEGTHIPVIPAKAGIQVCEVVDSRLRGNDEMANG